MSPTFQRTPFRLPTIRSAVEFRREAMGWTKMEMAKRLGIQRSHYTEFTKGQRRLPYRALCHAHDLGVPANVLLQTAASRRGYAVRQRRLLAEERAKAKRDFTERTAR